MQCIVNRVNKPNEAIWIWKMSLGRKNFTKKIFSYFFNFAHVLLNKSKINNFRFERWKISRISWIKKHLISFRIAKFSLSSLFRGFGSKIILWQDTFVVFRLKSRATATTKKEKKQNGGEEIMQKNIWNSRVPSSCVLCFFKNTFLQTPSFHLALASWACLYVLYLSRIWTLEKTQST